MRKIILGVAVSLDGFIEGPNGEYDWCFTDQDYGMTDFMNRIDTILMGRKSYEVAQQYEGASPWSGVKTYVFSRTLKSPPRDAILVSGDIQTELERIRQEPGKDLWLFGGADLTTQFINLDLIDEYWLSVHPIVLGSGKPLFMNLRERKKLQLKEHNVYNTGLVSLCYTPELKK
jgi:dihydrofolate reductase